MAKYTIGVDYGSLSGRAVLVNVQTGEEVASAVYEYPHAVMDETLWDGTKLGPDWALQHPQDYLDVLKETIPAVLAESKADPADVIGIGTDFTACTILPVKADGTPLCFLPEFEHNPHAYVKMWKHHAAQDKANRLNEIAAQRKEPWLQNYGGKISSEWVIPKLWQVLDEAPEIYSAMDRWIEAADWIIWQLCGRETRNSCTAGYKAMWNKRTGYPSQDFFKALDPRMENVVEEKLGTVISPLGEKAGVLTEEAAAFTGLRAGTAVAVGNVDAHVCVPAVGIDGPAKMLAIMGTSTCHIMMGETEKQVPGMCGVVADGVMPGYYGYEAGQSCVGDHFAWFVDNCLPASYYDTAKAENKNIHKFLREKAEKQKPGESGLLALDWWNGNRSILVDVDLTGMMLGMTLQTKPEEIYRALIEATAYGTRAIIENYREHGVPVEEFFASGGISQKDPMTMQIYADVIKMPIKIAGSLQGPALGSAIFAAKAAGKAAGGYDDIFEAARVMGKVKDTVYTPIPENTAVYDKLYAEYKTLHDYFGRGENDVMKRLKALKAAQAK
ncbi:MULTISPECIES: ribulokinase [Caproicibacterium]|uniref:Ribulokinase n=1 Tax=Caproicibacterium argilliputei TaxID=3030016 RepID=A0AA97DAB6_9FIRM|nr:ribulokinase [Caproicibacterium argilliputei]WOC31960.1 ribulokinase [Caproicibacterium argilliputei]